MQTERFFTLLKGFGRRYGRLLSLVLIAVALLSIQQRDPWGLYSGLQTSVWNRYQRWGAALNSTQPLVLVVQVDRKSIETVRRLYAEDWPWSRQRYAELLRILFEEYHVGVVGIDMFMPDTRDTPGNQQLLQLAQQYPIVFSQVFDFSSPDVAVEAGKLVGGLTPQDAKALDYFPQAQGYVGVNPQLA
ncbi:MAG: CHASE2 domain-containing protein, partial [Thiothrix sp.]